MKHYGVDALLERPYCNRCGELCKFTAIPTCYSVLTGNPLYLLRAQCPSKRIYNFHRSELASSWDEPTILEKWKLVRLASKYDREIKFLERGE